jgi:hypothetical protein
VLVGVAASVGLLTGFEPARLPPAMLNIAVYKLVFISALAILAVGAVVLRHARRGKDWRGNAQRPTGSVAPNVRMYREGREALREPQGRSSVQSSTRSRSG